jgi:hypothetical protein
MAGSPAITDLTPSAPAPATSTAPAKPAGAFSDPSVVIAAPVPVTVRDAIMDAISKVQCVESHWLAGPVDAEWEGTLAAIDKEHHGERVIVIQELISNARISSHFARSLDVQHCQERVVAAMRHSDPQMLPSDRHQIAREAKDGFDQAMAVLVDARKQLEVVKSHLHTEQQLADAKRLVARREVEAGNARVDLWVALANDPDYWKVIPTGL